MNFGPTELILILAIIIILFGVGRIGRIAGELGSGIRSFRKGLTEDESEEEGTADESEESGPDEIPPSG